ncbi:MAG TPA: DUF6152 family protein [Vicinamibacterales bacterium]|nr:DUF6152 family protein [Vicinamibacterales bacterium]
MRVALPAVTILAVLIAWSIPANAHHSNALYFTTNAVTLQGDIQRVEWINPHVLLFLQSKSENGEPETWVLQGSSLSNALRQVGSMKERLTPGTFISARVWLPRNPLYLNDAQTVLLTRPDDARKSGRIVGAGQIRLASGDVISFGGAPKF